MNFQSILIPCNIPTGLELLSSSTDEDIELREFNLCHWSVRVPGFWLVFIAHAFSLCHTHLLIPLFKMFINIWMSQQGEGGMTPNHLDLVPLCSPYIPWFFPEIHSVDQLTLPRLMLLFMGLQRAGHDLVTEQQQLPRLAKRKESHQMEVLLFISRWISSCSFWFFYAENLDSLYFKWHPA